MPVLACENCREDFQIAGSDWKYIDKNGPFVCSPECLVDIIKNFEEISPPFVPTIAVGDTGGKVHENFSGTFMDEALRSLRLDDTRSLYEKAVGEVLIYHEIPFIYEGFTFSWGTKTYTPDFYILGTSLFVEVKGDWGASQKSKYKKFREEFASASLIVVPWVISYKFFTSKKRKRIGYGIIR